MVKLYASEIEKKNIDDFSGSWGQSLDRAKNMKYSKFPICVIPWDDEKQHFMIQELDEIKAFNEYITQDEFFNVRFFF